MKTLTPQQRLDFVRKADVSPGIAMLQMLDMITEKMSAILEEKTTELSQVLETVNKDQIDEIRSEFVTQIADLKNSVDAFSLKEVDEESIVSGIVEKIVIPEPIHGHTPTEDELLVLIKKVMPEVKNGDTPSDAKLLSLIKKSMPKIESPQPINEDYLVDLIKSILPEEQIQDDTLLKKMAELQQEIELLKKLPRSKKVEKYLHGGGTSAVTTFNETPSGIVDGINNIFTVTNFPAVGSLRVYMNGQRLALTVDYTLIGKDITFINTPISGSIILVDYTNI